LRHKGRYIGETLLQRKDAQDGAFDNERRIDRGETAGSPERTDPTIF
jgi:hypothetical protein